MMYHLKFSLTGGASCTVGCPPSGFTASGFCSSTAIVMPSSCIAYVYWCCRGLVLGQFMQHSLDRAAEDGVHQPEVRGEDEDRNEDGDGRRLYLFARRADDFTHLAADVLEEGDEASRGSLQVFDTGVRGLFDCYCLRHILPLRKSWVLRILVSRRSNL